jgi:hypothetical protein
MFNKKIEEDLALEAEIARLLADMTTADRTSKEYLTMTDQLVKLYALKPKKPESRVSPDTLAIVAGNFAGILTIVLAEKSSVINSAARAFILKAR